VGDIVCKNADIEGKFEGTIEVAELLSIKSKASIQGSVKVGKLSVEPGADFSASCTMNNIKQHPKRWTTTRKKERING
jgi:cytoskeletal protein CcmA (bactofilin family)